MNTSEQIASALEQQTTHPDFNRLRTLLEDTFAGRFPKPRPTEEERRLVCYLVGEMTPSSFRLSDVVMPVI